MKRLENVWVYVDALAPAVGALAAAIEVSRRNAAARTLVGAIGRSEERMVETSSPVRPSRREHATSVSPLA